MDDTRRYVEEVEGALVGARFAQEQVYMVMYSRELAEPAQEPAQPAETTVPPRRNIIRLKMKGGLQKKAAEVGAGAPEAPGAPADDIRGELEDAEGGEGGTPGTAAGLIDSSDESLTGDGEGVTMD